MTDYKIYCGGEFLKSPSPLPVKNKYTGEAFAQTYLADRKILDKAVKAAEKARPLCGSLSSLEKYKALRAISEALEKNKSHLAEVLSRESAKPLLYATGEIERCIQTFLIAAEESKRLPREYMSLDWTENGKGREGIINYFPAGIVAGISPFNFPMNLAVHKIAPAIAAGCPIILKPASSTPLSALELARIIDQSGLPKGAVSVLPMDRETGNLLVTDARIQVMSFTGSPEVGWELKKQSGKKKVVLELGGNAGVIVSTTNNLKHTVKACIMGAFSYSGQICIHAQRFFVHEAIFDRFLAEMRREAGKLRTGDPLKKDTEFSVMIDEENARRVEEWVKEAIEQGARLVCGGKRKGSFFSPTILTGTRKGMKVYDEEVFGPVICVETYKGDIKDAVKKINDSKFGLQCGIFSDSVAELDYAYKHCEVGGVIHNHVPTLRFDQMPYGGVKESGLGREGVSYAIRDMMEARILVK